MDALLDWIGAHPLLALCGLFLAAALEAVFIVGIIIPGALILFAFGAIVALGGLDFWACTAAAAAGSALGDLLTFYIGRRYGPSLFATRWLARYPELVARGQTFFARHGGKSVVIGRFVGPLRPLMPAIAGAYAMRWSHYVAVTIPNCILWAMAYLLPGIVFGASLSLAAEVASRLVILLLSLVAGFWGIGWLVTQLMRLLQRHGERWINALLDWSNRHRRLGRLGAWMADADQPETPGLIVLALVLLAGGWLFLYLWWGIGALYPAPYDALIYQGLHDLYTPLAGFVAMAIAMLGEARVYVPVALSVLLTLLMLRRGRAAAHWLAAMALAALIGTGLYYLLPLPDPLSYYGGRNADRFSGRDLVLATAIYGFIPVLLATRRRFAARAWSYGIAVTLIALIAVAELYLGLQWASVAGFSIGLGGIWAACLALGYRRHRPQWIPARPFLWLVLPVFGVSALWAWEHRLDERMALLTPPVDVRSELVARWWQDDELEIPTHRVDIAGRSELEFNVQWLGEIDTVRAALDAGRWRAPTPLTGTTMLRWLSRSAPIATLPVLPQVHAGRHPALIRVRAIDADQQWVLRLWHSGWQLSGVPLWVGHAAVQDLDTVLGLMRFPSTRGEQPSLDARWLSSLPGAIRVQRIAPVATGAAAPVWKLRTSHQSRDSEPND